MTSLRFFMPYWEGHAVTKPSKLLSCMTNEMTGMKNLNRQGLPPSLFRGHTLDGLKARSLFSLIGFA